MIHLFNRNTAEERSFRTIDDLFRFIRNRENSRLLEDEPESGLFNWSFNIFKPGRIFALYHNIKEEYLTPPLQEAYEQQLDLLEMCKGDMNKPVQIPVTPDLDVECLRKIWCFEYCKAHGYEIRQTYEVPDKEALPGDGTEEEDASC